MNLFNRSSESVTIRKGDICGAMTRLNKPAQELDCPDPKMPKNRHELQRRFQLDQSPCLSNSKKLQATTDLLWTYRDAFSFDGTFGKTDLVKHQIKLKPDHHGPISQPYRPINPNLQTDLQKQLQTWMEQGIIERSNSPWNSALVAVPKKDGTIRWVIDYRKLNECSVSNSHPIGNIEDNLAQLSGSNIFSALNAIGAFHVIELTKDSKPLTAFATPEGSFQFVRLPFGLKLGPGYFARLVRLVLKGIPNSCALAYLDDLVIHSNGLEQHLENLEKVLQAFIKAGLKLKPYK